MPVTAYRLHWSLDEHAGDVIVHSADMHGRLFLASRHFDCPEELAAVASLLRHERPLWFHPESQSLFTGTGADWDETLGQKDGAGESEPGANSSPAPPTT